MEIQPTYGAALIERLSELAGIEITTGTLYPLLARLKKQGFVETEWEQSPVGPPRKIYSLSSKGRSKLLDLHGEWSAIARSVDTVMAHIQDKKV
ncbi:PadR family transcriptional regulator [Corynebacterium aquilae]|uniref:PadR family transcriptional regulator n=1 Tax=Corynebacterium aquilae TaxID=203263 RepID=UPI002482023E|nr:PadR family transcriptional regulator [Corynebacterium aquilae]